MEEWTPSFDQVLMITVQLGMTSIFLDFSLSLHVIYLMLASSLNEYYAPSLSGYGFVIILIFVMRTFLF